MWQIIKNDLRNQNYKLLFICTFILFLGMYTLLDDFNGGYKSFLKEFGVYLVIINILLNLLMSFISAFMITISTIFYKQSGKEGKGTALTGISYLFGILTYGCTPCVIAFFGTIGITFSVVALPLAGLPYKLVSLLIIIIGFFWLKYEISHAKCKIK